MLINALILFHEDRKPGVRFYYLQIESPSETGRTDPGVAGIQLSRYCQPVSDIRKKAVE